jgi:alpha-tubulin suppressor-like RCC1 family protein
VVGWGSNYFGQATPPPFLNHGFSGVAAGFDHSLALRGDGTVAAWGRNAEYQALVPPALTNAATANVQAIAAGGFHSLALRRNGSVICWGSNDYGQTNVPPGLSNVIAVAAGLNHCLALRRDGTVAAWGANNYGQIAVPSTMAGVLSIAAGGNRSLLVYQKQVVLLPPARRPAGGIVLYLANSDGSAMDTATLSRLTVLASASLTADLAAWTRYTNGFVLTNGLARWEDTTADSLSRRFYRTLEK